MAPNNTQENPVQEAIRLMQEINDFEQNNSAAKAADDARISALAYADAAANWVKSHIKRLPDDERQMIKDNSVKFAFLAVDDDADAEENKDKIAEFDELGTPTILKRIGFKINNWRNKAKAAADSGGVSLEQHKANKARLEELRTSGK